MRFAHILPFLALLHGAYIGLSPSRALAQSAPPSTRSGSANADSGTPNNDPYPLFLGGPFFSDSAGALSSAVLGLAASVPVLVALPCIGVLGYDLANRPERRPNKVAGGLAVASGVLLAGAMGAQIGIMATSEDPSPYLAAASVGYGIIGGVSLWMGIDALVRADAWDAAHPAGPETSPETPTVTPDAPPPATSFKLPPPRVSVAPVVSAQQQGLALVIAGW